MGLYLCCEFLLENMSEYFMFYSIFFSASIIALHAGLLIVCIIFSFSIAFQFHGPQKDPCGFNMF